MLALIRADEFATRAGFLEPGAEVALPEAPSLEGPRMGPWPIERLASRGGMGPVRLLACQVLGLRGDMGDRLGAYRRGCLQVGSGCGDLG